MTLIYCTVLIFILLMFIIKRGGGLVITVVNKAFVPKYQLKKIVQVNFPSQHVQFQEGFSLSTIYIYPGLAYVGKRNGFSSYRQHFYLNHAFHAIWRPVRTSLS